MMKNFFKETTILLLLFMATAPIANAQDAPEMPTSTNITNIHTLRGYRSECTGIPTSLQTTCNDFLISVCKTGHVNTGHNKTLCQETGIIILSLKKHQFRQ